MADGTVSLEKSSKVEVIDRECYLLRSFLSIEEQITLMQYIQEHDKTPSNRPKAMVSGPRTLILGENQPSLCFKAGQNPSVFSSIVDKATDIVKHSDPTLSSLRQYKHLSTAVIEYESPNGCFHPHIDHCQNSFVYLISLGCTANFMVKGPTMQTRLRFKFCSGDMLVFNASTEAAIGDSQSCPPELGDVFQKLRNHRYGVQT